MRILLTNDDGVYAPGLRALRTELMKLGEVTVVAPVGEQSAVGHSITLLAPVIETEAWVWVNGKYVGHRPYKEAYERPNELQLDVSKAIKPGKANVITMRVNTGMARAQAAGGLGARVLLYSPKAAAGKS